MTIQNCLLRFSLWLAVVAGASAAEVMPPKPAQWFNDYASVVPSDTVSQLNAKLQQFERDTSNQVVVAVWRDMQTDSSVQDYTFRIFQQWKLGQRDKNNGIGLFVFINARKMFIQVGYGLEGAVPDAIAKRIIEDEITPKFKTGDYGSGLSAGVDAILAASKKEYKGPGSINKSGHLLDDWGDGSWIFWLLVALFILKFFLQLRGGHVISGRGSYRGGWGSGGGWSSGGGGGFSGGGGRSGGGGAGGSW